MTDKQIIIDGLSCDNCAEFKRCQEQQTKKEYAINQVLQDIPSEYANIINRLKQIIPSITRCDYVLEKQLKRKEQDLETICKAFDIEYIRDKETNQIIAKCNKLLAREQECEALQMSENEAREIIAELKAECEELKRKVKELNQGWIDCNKERNLQEANSEFRQRIINRYKQTLTEIKEIADENIRISQSEGLNGVYRRGLAKQVLQKISEVLNDRQETN